MVGLGGLATVVVGFLSDGLDFVPGYAVIDAAQCKRGKYMAKCATIGYGFLLFCFSSLGELEADAVTLLSGSESSLHGSGHRGTFSHPGNGENSGMQHNDQS
uniref:Uncharacterized protein n=1 Tax=Tanacetum cinerariifolium TaxID=118510 RepID=A0A6L2JXE1_TANCI|nr:hypothetical protein [Tanacetum cinerariifolium]